MVDQYSGNTTRYTVDQEDNLLVAGKELRWPNKKTRKPNFTDFFSELSIYDFLDLLSKKKTQSAIYMLFSCPGSSIPDLGSQWLTATLEFWHKEWLLRLQTLQTFGRSDVQTKRQKDKKTIIQKDKKDKKTNRQKDKSQRPKREFNIVTSGQFRTLAMFIWYHNHRENGHFWCFLQALLAFLVQNLESWCF